MQTIFNTTSFGPFKIQTRSDFRSPLYWISPVFGLTLYTNLRRPFNPCIVIDDYGYDGNLINGSIDLTDKGIGVRQSFL